MVDMPEETYEETICDSYAEGVNRLAEIERKQRQRRLDQYRKEKILE